MQIKYERSGGLFPGAQVAATAEITATGGGLSKGTSHRALTKDEAALLHGWGQSILSSNLSGDLRDHSAGGADRYQYDLTIQEGEVSRALTTGDGPLKQDVSAVTSLINWFKKAQF